MDTRWLIDAIRDLADKADRANSAEDALDAVALDRDRWRNLAEALGAAATLEEDSKRWQLRLNVVLDGQMFSMAKDREAYVLAVLGKMHKDLMRHIDEKFGE